MENVTNPLFLTWAVKNPAQKEAVIHTITMKRQIFTVDSMTAINKLDELQGKHNIWFCGGYNIPTIPLLESGVTSAALLLTKWGVHIPWELVSQEVPQEKSKINQIVFTAVVGTLAVVLKNFFSK